MMLVGLRDDQIALLRAARRLKAINRDLRRMLQRQLMAGGGRPRIAQAETLLQTMEYHLRSVLLDTTSLTGREMHEHLDRAIGQAFDVLELLEHG